MVERAVIEIGMTVHVWLQKYKKVSFVVYCTKYVTYYHIARPNTISSRQFCHRCTDVLANKDAMRHEISNSSNQMQQDVANDS
jgi:ribosomal protein S27AE